MVKQSSKRYEHSPADREVAEPLGRSARSHAPRTPPWLGGMPQNLGRALGLHRIACSDIGGRAGLTATMRNSGTRQDDVVIRLKCYSKTTNSNYVRSYNTRGVVRDSRGVSEMKKLLLVSTALTVLFGGSALAADLRRPAYTPPPPPQSLAGPACTLAATSEVPGQEEA